MKLNEIDNDNMHWIFRTHFYHVYVAFYNHYEMNEVVSMKCRTEGGHCQGFIMSSVVLFCPSNTGLGT